MKLKLFTPLYNWALKCANHSKAKYFLAFLAFIESIFFPIPVDVVLAPMVLAKLNKALQYAFIATFFSVLGGVVGYYFGNVLWTYVYPLLAQFGQTSNVNTVQNLFDMYGLSILFLAGFTPLPYKVFTLTAGAMSMSILPFILISLLGRGMRFFLVALLMKWLGLHHAEKVQKYIEIIGWVCVLLFVSILIYKIW